MTNKTFISLQNYNQGIALAIIISITIIKNQNGKFLV